MSKVLQERGIGSLPGSTKPNPRDHVKSISTAKADSSVISHIRSGPYAVSDTQYNSLTSEIVLFPNRLHGYCCDDWKEARKVKILETYDHTLPQKQKDPRSFTLPCFIYDVCFDKALVDLGESVSVMPFSTYSNLGLGDLAHTRLTIELANRTIKHPRGIAENMLVRIGKFIFPIDFVILDIPEDDDVPLILRRPFLSTAHAKIDVFKRKITLRVGEEKLVFKSVKPATSIIRRVYMVKERADLCSKTEFVGEAIKESFDPLYGNYMELNDLDMPLEPRMNQDDFEPTLDFVNEPTYKSCYKMKFSCMIGYRQVNADFLPSLSINIMTKHFYNSIIKGKCGHEGKNLAGTLIDIPIFVGNFSIILGFSITDDMDITRGVVLGMPFFKKFVSFQKIMERFAHGDKCEGMDEE
ncbi:RNA-directed DNA polymerase [Tanacetum coccineum]